MPATNELLQEGRYRIDHSPTETGEEKIFEAYDTVKQTNVIVREIPVKLNRVATVTQREALKLAFATQAKALTEIEHEDILHVHDYFSEIDRQYLVMEAIEGESLAELIRRKNKPFSVTEVTTWADELLDALNYLHSRKPAIIHRNINPGNVTLHPSGKIKLIGVGVESDDEADFGSSQVDSDELRYSPMEQIWPGLDAASQKVITNSYDDRSERILKQPLDERSDIYSLGATLYYLITGSEPVDPIERSIEVLEGKLDPLREPTKVDSSIPAEISDVLMKALEIKRENRYDSAVIMRQVLQTAIGRLTEREQGDARDYAQATEVRRVADQAKAEANENEQRLRAEAEEKRRQAEAAELRMRQEAAAEEKRREAEAAEIRLREAKAEEQRQRELMEAQLREAEALRLKAEQQAEANRLQKEAEMAAIESSKSPAAAEVVAYRDTTTQVEEEELAAVLRELEEADSASQAPEVRKPVESQEPVADHVYESAIDTAPQPADAGASVMAADDDDEIFSVPQKTGSSLPMPAVAGLIGLVLMIAIGGWFVMSGSSEKSPPATTVEVAQPVMMEPTPAPDTIVSSTDPQAETTDVAADPAVDPSAPTATKIAAKPKKTDPKAESAKKKVTVDDLINDN